MTESTDGTVLVAVDGSRNSVVAAGIGARLAQSLGMHVGLLHVLDVPILSIWTGVEARLKDDIYAHAQTMLTDISERLQRAWNVTSVFYVVEGDPVTEIVKVVRTNPEIVAVVTGREGVGFEKRTELLPDRIGDRIGVKLANELSVPVLLVPPDVSTSLIGESLDEFRKDPGA